MFGIGLPELILVLAIALIVIGPAKLPEVAKSLGRAFGEFRKATSDLKDSFEIDETMDSVKKPFRDIDREFKRPVDPEDMPSTDSQPYDVDGTEKNLFQDLESNENPEINTEFSSQTESPDSAPETEDISETDNGTPRTTPETKNEDISETDEENQGKWPKE